MKYRLFACLAGLALASPGHAKKDPQAEIAEALKDKAPAGEERCLSLRSAANLRIVGTTTVLARNFGTVYRNDPPGGCPALTMRTRILTGNDRDAKLCIGDSLTVVDAETGEPQGACRMAKWQTYKSVK
ncbi:MAG TPA: hypothetical protein VL405_07230 [Sphingomonas sp.]|jgi:hypothetical protein|nr:hypothetical protein [Sphingomonas sp.]